MVGPPIQQINPYIELFCFIATPLSKSARTKQPGQDTKWALGETSRKKKAHVNARPSEPRASGAGRAND